MKRDEKWEHSVLCCEPFEGDFGDGEVRLKNHVDIARKEKECHLCGGMTIVGEKQRTMVEANYGELQTFHWCQTCCDAMVKSYTDNGKSWEARAKLRRERAS